MMRYRLLSTLRSYLLPAFAAMMLAAGPIACSSTGDEELTTSLEGGAAASGEESKPGDGANPNANANVAAAGDNAAANANAMASNTAKPEGEVAANNPVGTELNNAIAGDGGGANASAEAASSNTAAPANSAVNATEANTAAIPTPPSEANAPVTASPADANLSNPFSAGAAAPANASMATNAVPMNSEVAPALQASPANAAVEAGASTASDIESSGQASDASATVSGPSSLPEMGSKMAYYVMRGDTLASIALKIYGSRGKWKALQAENGLADANRIYPGDVIYYTLSESSKPFAEKYELASRQSYTVSKGDSLALLAAKFYGTQGAWRSLWKENPQILNPDRIRVGMVLTYRVTEKVALKDEDEGHTLEMVESPAYPDEREDEEVETINELLTAARE